jgi:hypothetical protein
MTRRARFLALAGGLIVLVLALLIVLPFVFRDRVAERAKIEANKSLNARVDWRDVGLTFFRNFPNLTLRLADLTVVGTGRFERDTLASIRHLGVALDLASVLRNVIGGGGKPIVVRSIQLEEPRFVLIKLEDGTANWDITKKAPEAAAPQAEPAKPVAISLRRVEIEDAAIAVDNRQSKLKASVKGYDQSLTGDLSQDQVILRTQADADTVSVTFAGIPYLNRVNLGLTADIHADLAGKSYALRDTELRLNDLRLGVNGSARSAGKLLGLDLTFNAPSTNFRSILSLVPAVYAHDFDKVKTSGTIAVNGRVQGEYGKGAFPSFAINAKVNDAAFQYPDLPLPARSIIVDLSLTNPGGSPDSTVVKLDRFHVLLGRNPIDAKMVLRTPVSDANLDLRLKGKLDLADIRRTIKLEGIEQLTGIVDADAAVRTRMSFVDKKQYDKVAASGSVDVANLTLKGKTLPHPLAIQQASLRLAPERAELKSFAGSIGSSDLQASGSLDNLIAFAFRDDTLRGSATVRSNRFNLDEWRSDEGDLQIIPVPPKVDFGLTATVAELTYDKLKMTNARGRLRIKNQRVTLEDFRMNTLGGEIAVSGFYETTDPAKPTFDVAFKMTRVDIPSAFEAFTTVQMLAPVAQYAIGKVTTDLRLNGALGKNMMPLFPSLSGRGALQTSQVALQNFPGMNKIVEATKLQLLNNPTLRDISTKFQIKDGRLQVAPFAVKLGPTTMNVSGSNGLDQSMQYDLQLRVPRSELGAGANQAISGLLSKAGQAGIDLGTAPEIPLGIQLSGTVTNPAVKAEVGSLASSVAKSTEQAVRQAATEKVSAEATRVVQAAERQAADIRQQAQSLADRVKQEGYQQADALTAKADNPILKAAAEPAAQELRDQADDKAAGIVNEASRRADSLVAEAERKANQIADEP